MVKRSKQYVKVCIQDLLLHPPTGRVGLVLTPTLLKFGHQLLMSTNFVLTIYGSYHLSLVVDQGFKIEVEFSHIFNQKKEAGLFFESARGQGSRKAAQHFRISTLSTL